MRKLLLPAFFALFAAVGAHARIVTQTVDYSQDGKTMKGYLAYDDARSGARPGVLVIHEWWGLNEYVKGRARQLAEMGYVAFAADMFGGGKATTDPKEAEALYNAVEGTPGLTAARAKAGLDVLRKQKGVDPNRVAAIGFCFGGTSVLRLAYSGEPLKAAVTFHGGLVAPKPDEAAHIRTPILVLHGAEDSFVTPETITQMTKAFDAAKVDWYMVTYARAVHAFTNPDADKFHIPGIGYNEKAATRSWDEMKRFFGSNL
ncbi:MAG: dienelactone hydrolase family protein [Bacillota bacterium]